MRADSRYCVLVLLVAAALQAGAAPPPAFEAPLRAALAHCLERNAGRERVELSQRCPRLERLLHREAAAGLPRVGVEPKVATLENLHRLVSPPGTTPGAVGLSGVDYTSLDAILSQVYQRAAEPAPGLWTRFIRWLREVLGDNVDASYVDSVKRFFEWIERNVPLGQIFGWLLPGLLIALVIAAVALLFHQLVSARGMPRWTLHRGRGDKAGRETHAADPARSLADIRRLPSERQPAAVLHWAIGILVHRNALPAQRNRTNGELLRQMRDDPAGSRVFEKLVVLVEPCIYGGRVAGDEQLNQVYRCVAALDGGEVS